MTFSVSPYAYSASSNGGNTRLMAVARPGAPAAENFRARVIRSDDDSTNFPGNLVVTVNWIASLSEF